MTTNQTNCKHFPSTIISELKNKRECVLCKKLLDEDSLENQSY